MLRPFLFVGVGGSGGKVLAVTRDQIRRRLGELGWEDDFPSAFQFLHFDVAAEPDSTKSKLPRLPDACFHSFAPDSDLEYASFDDAVTGVRTSVPRTRALGTWRPDPALVGITPSDGAGMYRALGRVIGLSGLDEVRDRVDSARTLLTDTGPAELKDLADRLGERDGGAVPDPFVVVVSSVAGGSGSGIFLDVCDAIRSLGVGWADKSTAVLLAPDTFPRVEGIGLQGNALASVSEVLAGYWNIGEAGPEEFELLRPAGVTPNQLHRRGARYNFMVGGSNGVVTFHDSEHVYEALGTALCAWALNGNIQGKIRNSVFGNYEASATREDKLPLRPVGSMQPFGAFGYARVDLGRRQFAEYAAERLARLAATSILRGHLADVAERRDVAPQDVIAERVSQIGVINYAHRLGVRELGERHNDIVEMLYPRRDARIANMAAGIVAEVTGGGDGQRSAGTWKTFILERFDETHVARFLDEDKAELVRRARSWVTSIQHRILAEVAETLATEGSPVTVGLLEGVESYLDGVVEDLSGEASREQGWGERYADGVVDALISGGDPETMIPATSQRLYDAAEAGLWLVQNTANAVVLEMASVLVRDLRAGVISVLRRAIEHAEGDLRDEDVPSKGRGASIVRAWPSGTHVPSRFRPTATVILVEPANEYPARFSALLERSIGGGERGAERKAARAVVLGDAADEYPALASGEERGAINESDAAEAEHATSTNRDVWPELIQVQETWWPTVSELQHAGGRARSGRYVVKLSAATLLSRAKAWVRDPDHQMGSTVMQSLRSYLEPADRGYEDRRVRFNRAFSTALDRSRPLVDIDRATLSHVHGDTAPEYEVVMTPLDFDPQSAIVADILQALTNHVDDADGVSPDFGEPPNDQVVEIFSFLKSPVEPVVIRSLMAPIAEAWTEAIALSTPDEPSAMELEFWNRRRARPLRHAIPASPANLDLMIRGWYVAHALAQLDRNLVDGCSIWVPGKGASLFPRPLIRPNKRVDVEWTDLLAIVLESIPLALVDFPNNHSSLAPYERLANLGKIQTSLRGASPLVNWINGGTLDDGAPTPDPELAGSADGDPESRRGPILAVIAHNRAKHEEIALKQTEASVGDLAALPLAADLAADVVAALTAFERELGSMTLSSSGGSDKKDA